jgi:hypothetical protein
MIQNPAVAVDSYRSRAKSKTIQNKLRLRRMCLHHIWWLRHRSYLDHDYITIGYLDSDINTAIQKLQSTAPISSLVSWQFNT